MTPIVLGRTSKIVIINKPYYNYYQRSGSIQNGEFNERRFAILQTARLCIDNAAVLGKEKQNIIKKLFICSSNSGIGIVPCSRTKIWKKIKAIKRVHEAYT